MATISTPIRSRNLAEARQRVQSPLERLRSYIRLYVALEGAAVVGLYLALWFWIGLLLDYGPFRLFGFDWVQALQESSFAVHAVVLALLVIGLLTAVALKVVTRLFREFRDPALALVLEKRFPDILGDRLITAVELSDPDKAAELGYSADMVRETIHEAAGRVDQLPIKEVFDWGRLRRRGILVACLIVVGYLLAGAGWCTANAIQGYGVSVAGFGQFHEVAGIWFERNILLQSTIWPRQAHLELVDFPESGEIRIGRGEKSPTIRVRALKYVIAGAPSKKAVEGYREWLSSRGVAEEEVNDLAGHFSKKPVEGWRAVSWFDLPDVLGAEAPSVGLPADWEARDRRAGLTLDEVELNLDKPDTHKTLNADAKDAMRNALTELEARATDPANSRKLRRLQIPDTVVLSYKGNTTRSETTMQKLADNEYTGQFGDLKETVRFTVQGLDYYTAWRKIVVVEPPSLESLVREEERPAYLYYRPGRDDQPEELSGKKQLFEAANVSLQGGEVSRIDVPVGTNLTLTARASKDIKAVTIVPHKAHKGGDIQASPPEMLDSHTFRTSFKNVRREQNFLFRFTDSDNVTGQRQVVVVPSEDAPPKILELAPDDIVRKVQGGFMVTVSARVPFKGKVIDDHGLSGVRYAYSIGRMESASKVNRRTALPVGAVPLLAPAGQGFLPGLVYLTGAVLAAKKPADTKTEPVVVQHYALPLFDQKLRDQPAEFLPMKAVQELLGQRQKEPYRALLRNFEIKADDWKDQPEIEPLGCDLPLWKDNLKITDPTRPQPRYQVQIWVEAADTDLDSDKNKDGKPQPHVKTSDEKFTFFVVSENELLAEIAKEEEKLYVDLDRVLQGDSSNKGLQEMQTKLVRTTQDLSSDRVKAEELGSMSVRCDQVGDVLVASQAKAHEVALAYSRILREMKTNRVDSKFVEKVDKSLVTPLSKIDGTFEQTRDAVLNFRKALDSAEGSLPERIKRSREAGDEAKKQMRELVLAVERILNAMAGMTDINKLVKILAEIEKQERDQYETITKIKDKLEDDLFNKVSGGDKKPEAKKPDEDK